MTFLAGFLGLPRWAHALIGAAALAASVLIWLHFHDRAAVMADRAKANAEAHETARRADEAAQGETDRVKTQVETENERARDAAKDSSDPLADALRSLRR